MGGAGAYDRGKVMSAEELEAGHDFGRYKDVDGDGIPWRTLPGTHADPGAISPAVRTRDPYARYSERGPDYIYNVERLLRKFPTAAALVPPPVLPVARQAKDAAWVSIYFGSTSPAMQEALDVLASRGRAPRRAAAASLPVQRRGGGVHRQPTTRCSSWSRTAMRRCVRCS